MKPRLRSGKIKESLQPLLGATHAEPRVDPREKLPLLVRQAHLERKLLNAFLILACRVAVHHRVATGVQKLVGVAHAAGVALAGGVSAVMPQATPKTSAVFSSGLGRARLLCQAGALLLGSSQRVWPVRPGTACLISDKFDAVALPRIGDRIDQANWSRGHPCLSDSGSTVYLTCAECVHNLPLSGSFWNFLAAPVECRLSLKCLSIPV
jgi:hypothetical protein